MAFLVVSYLVWLGYKKWTQPPISIESDVQNIESKQRQFWQAALVNIANPKATVFLLALFPQFVDTQAIQSTQYLVMGITLILADIIVMIGYASLASKLSQWMKSKRHQTLQNRVFGGMFVGAATLMASYRNT